MPIHCCLDPQDPYAEREVRVAFAWTAAGPHLIAARDALGTDILPDLIDAQCEDLRREIVAATRPSAPPRHGGLPAPGVPERDRTGAEVHSGPR